MTVLYMHKEHISLGDLVTHVQFVHKATKSIHAFAMNELEPLTI